MGDEVFDRKTGGGSTSTILMEQQKMNCALQRSCSNTQKTTDWENNSVSTKSLEENNFRASSNVCEVSSLAWRNSDHKCAVLAFFAVEPHGHWRITLPMQCPEPTIHLRSGSQVKMDGLHLVSPPLVSSVRVDQPKGRRGPTSEKSSSIKSFTTRKFSGSNLQYQSRNKGFPNNMSRWNALLGNSSCQTSLNSCDSSVMIPTGCNATSSSDTQISLSKADKSIRRNPKKKARKKGNRNKKPGSANLEYVHGSSTSETGVTKNADYVIAPLPCTTRLAVLSPGRIGKHGDSDGNSSGNVSSSEKPKICTSYIEGDILETNIIGEHCSPNNYFPEFPIFSGLQDTNSKPTGCSNDPCSSVFSETNDSSVLDSTSVCSDGEKVIEASCKLSTKGIGGTNLFESPGYIPRNGLFSLPNMLNGVEDSNCHIRETTYREARRGKQLKHVHRNSSISRLSSSEKFSGRSGKENNHSIWQKVQRNDNDECRSGLRKVNSANSQSGAGLKEVPLPKKKCNGPQSNILSTCEGKSQSKVKASRKVKRKTSPGSKQELNYYSRRGSYATKASSNVCRKINMKQNEVLDIPAEFGGKKGLDSISGSCSEISGRVESIMSEPAPILEGRPNELEPLEHVCASLSSLNDQTSKRESSSLSAFCDYQDLTELLEGQSTGHLYPPGGESTKISQNVSPGAHNKQEQSCESTLRRWIPVGMKDYELASSVHSNSLQLAYLSKPSGEVCPLENTVREMTSDADISSTNASIMHGDQAASVQIGVHSQDEVQIEKHPSQSTCTLKESCVNQVTANCLIHDQRDKIYSAVENESNKIAQAVNDAYRAQLASEVVQMATGSPIAEFERLLSSASPVLSLPHNSPSCEICLPDEIVGSPLCRHEMPNISLGSLWQWYEKHGTYGLEVRAKEYDNPKRFGIDSVAFCAYFVPFLSAVQLFRNCKSPSDSSGRAAGTEAMEEARTFNKRPGNSSNVGRLPIFPILFPQPHMDTSSLSARNSVCCSEMSSVFTEGNESIQSNDSSSSDDLELIFEYFEVEQPQNRRPMFEMIKELVGGGGPSQCRAYGDPTKLDSVTMNDLHHKSWYSVAWYPIYRIPDDNFRAAFLTYHSLGHLVRQSVTSDSFGVGACVVSPVVGLQSYNAQGECWFQLRQPALMSQTTEIPNSNPSRILKERLRTLEQTASLMARAAVTKGNLTSVNRQPDYEFFLSRRCW